MTTPDERSLLQLFEQIMPAERWREIEGENSAAQIYSLPVVVWMMLFQRLDERGTQQEAVHQIGMGRLDRLLPDCKRVREEAISPDTGGYARACGRTSIGVLGKACEEVLGQLRARIEPQPDFDLPVMIFDGTSLTLEHVKELLKAFPPGSNQYGPGHWGILKVLGLHDVQTGIALRPAWGPMYGPNAVSEQQLAEEALAQAPTRSVVIGDGNFGVFWLAHAVDQSERYVLFRLTKQRAHSLHAAELLPTGERSMCWRPTRKDRENHPELPHDAKIEGRLIVVTREGFRETLYLFTTLDGDWEKIAALYAKRWHIELDLRALKRTLRLHHLRGKSRDAVEKELLIAVVAYGLVRAFMALAARRVGLQPRELSFTRCYGLLNAGCGMLCSTRPEERERGLERILRYMGKSKLPKRSKRRSFPRATWGFRQAFPTRGPGDSGAKSK